MLHWNGEGGPRNLTAANQAFRRGAAHEHGDSLYNLVSARLLVCA